MVCDNVMCERWCMKCGVWQRGVWKMVCDKVGVWQSWCVTKLCVKDGVWQSCVGKMVCDKVVCKRWCVTKRRCMSPSATPATQKNEGGCHQVPGLLRKTKVDVTKCHACQVKRRWMSPQCLVNCGYCLERLEAFVWGNIAIIKKAILRSFSRGRRKGADAPSPFFVHSKSVFLADGEKVANRIGTVTFNAAASDIDAWSPILARCSFWHRSWVLDRVGFAPATSRHPSVPRRSFLLRPHGGMSSL